LSENVTGADPARGEAQTCGGNAFEQITAMDAVLGVV